MNASHRRVSHENFDVFHDHGQVNCERGRLAFSCLAPARHTVEAEIEHAVLGRSSGDFIRFAIVLMRLDRRRRRFLAEVLAGERADIYFVIWHG